MKLEKKVIAVESIFLELEYQLNEFQRLTGLKCLNLCCQCCKYTKISATILEFLPLAYFITRLKFSQVWRDRINRNIHDENPTCAMLKFSPPWKNLGRCAIYNKRGLICRLFGFSAVLDKSGQKRFSTCTILKNRYPTTIKDISIKINKDYSIPVMKDYYFRLLSIDFYLAHQFFPINVALLKALEIVDKKNSLYYSVFNH